MLRESAKGNAQEGNREVDESSIALENPYRSGMS